MNPFSRSIEIFYKDSEWQDYMYNTIAMELLLWLRTIGGLINDSISI